MAKTATPRQQARQRTMAEILRIGREQLATEGAAALSLRAVARELGVVSSAVYRYVASRDELLTMLLVEAYTELGDRVDAAVDAAPAVPFERFAALARAVREWALAEPARYGLLFGAPVPGYQAPAEQTTAPGIRVVMRLARIIQDAWAVQGADSAEDCGADAGEGLPPRLAADLDAIRSAYGLTAPAQLVARGMMVWSGLFGAVSFEVFGQYGPATFTDSAQFFEFVIRRLAEQAGIPESSG
ncbi:TetR/AcrR family transcriptional regulator [Arthrobacter sp. I2-34]|uniref:TetR/AcrR family transcriptional regulator n=1 Tax=Arthrobacter hankyongi TaxID=2904801 RepID=A0ABS9L2N8_9MICC|nr:TetR/AcrR family transcriptional regulator [Arthrobacter hankyongi]MCG2620886.1 TetR/AcrR family transcriptional regulator [Arthrobacter hankyongi]